MLPKNTAERLSKIYGVLQTISKDAEYVTSKELAAVMGTTDFTIRKDIGALNIMNFGRKGYHVEELSSALGRVLQLTRPYRTCVVGLGKLGTAVLDYEAFKDAGFDIVAGFDINLNKVERLHTEIAVYHSSDLDHIVKSKSVEVAIIAVPQASAQEVATTLVANGVKAILNFSPAQIKVPKGIALYNMDFTAALRFVVSQI